MIRFSSPEWFLLVPVLLFLGWRWRFLVGSAVRVLILILGLLALAGLQLRLSNGGLDLWVLVDRSASAESSLAPLIREWEGLLERSKGSDDRLFFIDYAEAPGLRSPSSNGVFEGGREATKTGLALEYALTLADPAKNRRLLVLTDGYSTEPLSPWVERLLKEKVALDYRFTTPLAASDYKVEALTLPKRAFPGEPFLLELKVSGRASSKVPFEIFRDGASLMKGSVEIPPSGRDGVARFVDRVQGAGGYRYTARIYPDIEQDAHAGNNTAEQWVEISGGARVLLVTRHQGDDPLYGLLKQQGFEVDLVDQPKTLHAGRLQGARAVILNNVPAYDLPSGFLKELDFFVREQGGGLLMGGGKQSFAAGGYFGSEIGDLLPVSMEMRQNQVKAAVALVVALDRSGSMSVAVPGGEQKIDLANAGAARAVELLGPQDQVAVFAVDTAPHCVVPLSRVGGDAARLAREIRTIGSQGGGINVYTALKAAYDELQKSPRGMRHIILFADANDAEEPGDYKALLSRMSKEQTTVSVIALGKESDSDAAFLKEIASLGNGRIFFSEDAATLPALFEQETVAVARSAFIDEPASLAGKGGWMELAAKAVDWLPAVDAYNLCYLRPEATLAASTRDEEEAPLVAFWHRGSGRVAAVAFPLSGAFSERVRGWTQYGDFIQTLTRWTQGNPNPPGLALKTAVKGSQLSAELLFTPEWEATFAKHPPQIVLAAPLSGMEKRWLTWERMEPGRYRTTASLKPGEVLRGALQAGDSVIPFGPIQVGGGAEWEMKHESRLELAEVSRRSGGEERGTLDTVWKSPRPPTFASQRTALLAGLLGLFLLDTLLKQLGRGTLFASKKSERSLSGSPSVAIPRKRRGKARPVAASDVAVMPPPDSSAVAETPPASEIEQRRSRFARAKRRL